MNGEFAEPVRILSDLHLGHIACALPDVRMIRPLLEGAKTVIFNGDTIEERCHDFQPRALEENAKLRSMLDELGIQPVFLTGNHDPTASDRHSLELLGGRLLVTHGDFLFRYISPWSHTVAASRPRIDEVWREVDEARFLSDFDYCLEVTRRSCEVLAHRKIHKPPDLMGRARYYGREFWPPRRVASILAVWMTSAGRILQETARYRPESRVVVFGHIHCPGVWRRAGRVAINTGGFLNAIRARVVEVEAGAIQVRRVSPKRSELRLEVGRQVILTNANDWAGTADALAREADNEYRSKDNENKT